MVGTIESITLAKMVAFMDSGQTFSIAFRTCNIQKDKGGEYIFFDECIKHNHLTMSERKANKNNAEQKIEIIKNPNHYLNSTRNIMRVSSGELVKIHLRLIRRFNGKIVL